MIVYKLDRLSRRVRDTLSLMDLIEKSSVAFHSITERIDTKSAMGKFFLNIMASMNQWERDTISERTRDALHLKIVKNERAGQVPYGWRLGVDGKTLFEDETEQKAIALIKELHGKGYSSGDLPGTGAGRIRIVRPQLAPSDSSEHSPEGRMMAKKRKAVKHRTVVDKKGPETSTR